MLLLRLTSHRKCFTIGIQLIVDKIPIYIVSTALKSLHQCIKTVVQLLNQAGGGWKTRQIAELRWNVVWWIWLGPAPEAWNWTRCFSSNSPCSKKTCALKCFSPLLYQHTSQLPKAPWEHFVQLLVSVCCSWAQGLQQVVVSAEPLIVDLHAQIVLNGGFNLLRLYLKLGRRIRESTAAAQLRTHAVNYLRQIWSNINSWNQCGYITATQLQ